MVKRVQLVFDDDAHSTLIGLKEELGLSWEEFVLELVSKYPGRKVES